MFPDVPSRAFAVISFPEIMLYEKPVIHFISGDYQHQALVSPVHHVYGGDTVFCAFIRDYV